MKISARDILVFVAGALALLGTRALLYLPYYYFDPAHNPPVHNAAWFGKLFYSSAAGLDLPLGLAMLFGRRWAILLTQIWLWLSLAFVIFNTFFTAYIFKSSVVALIYIWSFTPDMVIAIVLLLLIHLSRSRKFQADRTPHKKLGA
jgi:hypothetical protein